MKSIQKFKIPLILVSILVVVVMIPVVIALGSDSKNASTNSQITGSPSLKTDEITNGLSNIWDMVFVDDETIIFDERGGALYGVSVASKDRWQIGVVPNVRSEGEGGLLGLAKDAEFESNRTMYACYNATGAPRTVRVTRFTLSTDNRTATGFTDIIDDIESKAGRHSGCRLAMDRDKVLWVATGDSAIGSAPMDPNSLAGKVLRVNRDGTPASGNAGSPFDARIYNYGHRNIQGLVLFDEPLQNGAMGLTAEHGPDREDEINWLLPGNFGWDPNGSGGSSYDESVPMTDIARFPDAVPAVWNSGSSTIAVSGMTMLTSQRWGAWQNWAAVAVLKDKHVRLLNIQNDGTVPNELEILKDYGRIRAVLEGPNGDLYLSTDNGRSADRIIRVVPE